MKESNIGRCKRWAIQSSTNTNSQRLFMKEWNIEASTQVLLLDNQLVNPRNTTHMGYFLHWNSLQHLFMDCKIVPYCTFCNVFSLYNDAMAPASRWSPRSSDSELCFANSLQWPREMSTWFLSRLSACFSQDLGITKHDGSKTIFVSFSNGCSNYGNLVYKFIHAG